MMYKRIYKFWIRYTLFDFIRKCYFYSISTINFTVLFNKTKALLFFKNSNLILGKNIKISGISINIKVGSNCVFYDNSIFEFAANSIFEIGNNCVLSYGVLLSCNKSIKIGDDVQIGEYTSIRDTTHDYSDLGVPIKYNADISKEISIGNNVWIGRGCIILPGTIIEDGIVIGANSVVKGHLLENNIYAGSPVKFVKSIR